MDQMEMSATARIQRQKQIVAHDVAYVRSDVKGLRNMAREVGTDFDVRQLNAALDLMDRVSAILGRPDLLHPTLF